MSQTTLKLRILFIDLQLFFLLRKIRRLERRLLRIDAV